MVGRVLARGVALYKEDSSQDGDSGQSESEGRKVVGNVESELGSVCCQKETDAGDKAAEVKVKVSLRRRGQSGVKQDMIPEPSGGRRVHELVHEGMTELEAKAEQKMLDWEVGGHYGESLEVLKREDGERVKVRAVRPTDMIDVCDDDPLR